jgi:hypothetical protein
LGAGVVLTGLAGFWLWDLDRTESMLVLIGGALMALQLALQDAAVDAASGRTIVVTKRSLVLALWALVVSIYLYVAHGSASTSARWCVSCAARGNGVAVLGAPRGRLFYGLLGHPLRDVRPHLVQSLNIWLCCALLGGVVAAGGAHFARIAFALTCGELNVLIATFIAAWSSWRIWHWFLAAASTYRATIRR